MHEDDRRTVLAQVAAGEMTPEDALARLEAAPEDEGATSRTASPASTPTGDREAGRVRRVRVTSELGLVAIVGDDQVAEAVAGGGYTAHREGDTLVLESEELGEGGGRYRAGRIGLQLPRRRGATTVRVNPDLPLELEVTAGKVTVAGMRGPLRAVVDLGTLDATDVRGPIDVEVTAGQVTLQGRLEHGDSRIRCELGRVRLDLDRGSSVTVTGRAEIGTVRLPTGHRQDGDAVVVGDGTARLDVSTTAGSVEVRA